MTQPGPNPAPGYYKVAGRLQYWNGTGWGQDEAPPVTADPASTASPTQQAVTAYARGDEFFQLELAISSLRGATSAWGSSDNQVQATGGRPDLLGQIEAAGWHLEHVGYVFVETGSTSTNRLLQTGEGTVTRGTVTGIYLFRRTPTNP